MFGYAAAQALIFSRCVKSFLNKGKIASGLMSLNMVNTEVLDLANILVTQDLFSDKLVRDKRNGTESVGMFIFDWVANELKLHNKY